jgi:hypothetical protein
MKLLMDVLGGEGELELGVYGEAGRAMDENIVLEECTKG